MTKKTAIRQVVRIGVNTYDALYNSVYVGTYTSKAQAEAALKGVAAYLQQQDSRSSESHKGIRYVGKRYYITYPKGIKGSFITLDEALAHQASAKTNQPLTTKGNTNE